MASVVLNITATNGASPVVGKVSADLDKLGATANKAKTNLGGIGSGFDALAAGAVGASAAIGAIAAGIAALGAGAAGLLKLATAASAFGENVQNASARLGIATDAVQELMKIGKDAGVGFDAIAVSVNKMQVALANTPKVFTALGLDAKSLSAASPDKALAQVATRISEIGNQSQKTAALVAVFGRGGAASMAPLLDAFAEGRKRAADLGAVLSDRQLFGLAAFDQSMDDLGTAWDGLWLQLGSAIGNSPAIVEAIEGITAALVNLSKWVKDHEADFSAFFDAILSGALSASGGFVALIQRLPGGETLVEKWFGSKEKVADYFKAIDDGINRIVGRTRDRALGILPKLPAQVSGSRPGANSAAEEAEKAALRAATAWTKSAESARAAWDKFDQDMAGIGKKITDELLASAGRGETIKEMGKRLGEQFLEGFKASPGSVAGQDQIKKNIREINGLVDDQVRKQKELKDAAIEAAEALAGAFFGLSDAFHQLGDDIGGIAGEIAHFAGAGVNAFAAIQEGIAFAAKRTDEFGESTVTATDKVNALANAVRGVGQILSGPGGAKGAAGGALSGAALGAGIGSVFPGIGTLLGAGIGAAAGGILGLFGGGKKKADAEEVKQLQQQLLGLGGTMEDLKKLADKFGISLGNAFNTKKPQDVKNVIDQLTAAIEKQKKVLEGLSSASDALTGIFTKLSPTTEKGAAAQATIFSTVFWATVKEKGYGPAIDALSAPFEALKKSLSEKFGPEVTNRLLGSFAVFFDPKVKESISVFSDIQQALEGVSQAGYLTKDAFAAFGQTATDAFAQATAGGLSNATALQAIAPLLASIVQASNTFGFAIDENTQKLIDQAKAAGIAFPVSPIDRAATAMERVAKAIERAFGFSEDLGNSLNNLPKKIPTFPGGTQPNITGYQSKYGGGDVTQQGAFHGFGNPIHAAEGWGPKVVPNLGSGLGPMFQTHAGELVMIVPKKDVSKNKGLIYGDFGKKDKKDKGLGGMYGKVIQAAEGFGRRDDPREPREPRDPRQPQTPPPSAPGTSAPPAATPVRVVQAIHQNQRKQDEKFDRVLAVLEKVAKNADKQQPVTVAVTQQSTFNLDASQVASNKQAFLQEVGAHLAQDMKAGGSALGRAVQGQIEKTVGRGRAKAS